MLRKRPSCNKSADIKRHIMFRLRLGEEGKFDTWIQDTTNCALNGAGSSLRTEDPGMVARAFNSRVIDGNMRLAVGNLTGGVSGGLLGPKDACT